MSDIKPTTSEVAIDQLESWIADGRYPDPCSIKPVVRIILDELTRVQAELNSAAGEIVVLRERIRELDKDTVWCESCHSALPDMVFKCPHCGRLNPPF